MSVLKIECSVAVIGLPVAERAARYMGLDSPPRGGRRESPVPQGGARG